MSNSLPEPVLRQTVSLVPFAHFACQKMGPGRVFFDCVVVKATFELGPGVLRVADEQAPIELSDTYHDELDASRSSLRRPGDLHLAKPGTDVLVTGTARPPGGRPIDQWTTEVMVLSGKRPVLEHRLVATGPRRWEHRALRGWGLSSPEPTTAVPIRYELAYGGHHRDPEATESQPRYIVYRPNPSGTGFFLKSKLDASRTYPGPQWELPGHPITAINQASPLAGFGPVARMWEARLRFAGTYDAAWEAQVRADAARGIVPDYPADFDARFFQCAHPALAAPRPLGGEEGFFLRGLSAEMPELAFRLPPIRLRAEALGPFGQRDLPAPPLDLVHIDLDARRVHATFRFLLHPRDEIAVVALRALEENAPC